MNTLDLFTPATEANNIMSFAQAEAHRMWPSAAHRTRSLAQLGRFVDFRDHSTKPIGHFLPRDVHAFADHLVTSGASAGTVNRYLASISKVFNHAVDEQIINVAPRLKFMREQQKRIRFFTEAEQAELVAYFNDLGLYWMRDMLVLSLKTGVRRGEIVALGEGRAKLSNDGHWLMLPSDVTKTNKSRNVPLGNQDAREAAQRLAATLGQHYSKRKFEQAWAKAQRDVGKGDRTFVFHVARHTCASYLANDLQINTVVIAEMLGHASLTTTSRYIHAKPDALLDISKRM